MNPRKNSPQARGAQSSPQPRNLHQARAPQPNLVQRKTATSQVKQPPKAPPAYRPQPVPKVLQTKMPGSPQPVNQSRTASAPPPVYRPQPTPKVLQAKANLRGQLPVAQIRQQTGRREVNSVQAKPQQIIKPPFEQGNTPRLMHTRNPGAALPQACSPHSKRMLVGRQDSRGQSPASSFRQPRLPVIQRMETTNSNNNSNAPLLGSEIDAHNTTRLYHYTDSTGYQAIINSKKINPSTMEGRKHTNHGKGIYLSTKHPFLDAKSDPAGISGFILGLWQNPHPKDGEKVLYYIEIAVPTAMVKQVDTYNWMIPGENPLALNGNLISHGKTWFGTEFAVSGLTYEKYWEQQIIKWGQAAHKLEGTTSEKIAQVRVNNLDPYEQVEPFDYMQ